MTTYTLPRVLLTAPNSGSGKTTVTCGILKVLLNKKIKVTAFKSGPDYIDPMFHTRVIGANSRNLDVFMLGETAVKKALVKNAKQGDIAVLEGAMGFYDGMGDTTVASAYDLARITKTPVVLVVDAKGAALSLAAIIKGFSEFRKDSNIQGVILNRVSKMSYLYYKDVLEKETGVKMLGYVPILQDCSFESRHLGLITASEIKDLEDIIEKIASNISDTIDFDELLKIANGAESIVLDEPIVETSEKADKVRIAVAKDKAFCFYYQDALDLLEELGAEIVEFSPLKDKELPNDIVGIFLGGGYPELYAKELAENTQMLANIKSAITNKMPCYAECGGFMYLLENFATADNNYSWVGAIKGTSKMTDKLTRFGYVKITAENDNLMCKKGEYINGHEFHYSDSDNNGECFNIEKASGRGKWVGIHATETLFAGYPHFHLLGNPSFAKSYLNACRKYFEVK